MPKAMKKSAQEQSSPHSEGHESVDTVEASSSDQDQDPDYHFVLQSLQMVFILCSCHILRDLKVNWTVDDRLYQRFLKWHLKCKTILDCKLENLPTNQKCQKVIAWSVDFGMDLYVSWNIPKEDLTLDAIWAKFKEFSKP